MAGDIQLHRNAFGQLVFRDSEGREHVNVELARAFPISAPLDGISMLDQNGREVAWIPRLEDLSREIRRLLEEELQSRELIVDSRGIQFLIRDPRKLDKASRRILDRFM